MWKSRMTEENGDTENTKIVQLISWEGLLLYKIIRKNNNKDNKGMLNVLKGVIGENWYNTKCIDFF